MFAVKESHDRQLNFFKTGTNNSHQKSVSAIESPFKQRYFCIGCIGNSVSMDDIKEYYQNKAVGLLYIRELSRDESGLKSFHCFFLYSILTKFFLQNSDSKMIVFTIFLNQKTREWLAAFDTWLYRFKSVSNSRSIGNTT